VTLYGLIVPTHAILETAIYKLGKLRVPGPSLPFIGAHKNRIVCHQGKIRAFVTAGGGRMKIVEHPVDIPLFGARSETLICNYSHQQENRQDYTHCHFHNMYREWRVTIAAHSGQEKMGIFPTGAVELSALPMVTLMQSSFIRQVRAGHTVSRLGAVQNKQ
jgi:hypothetical protein